MFKTLITFGLGVYTGVYVAQNYQVERVDEPRQLWEKLVKYIDETMKGKK